MKGFLIILLMLGVIGGSVYVYDPELLDIDSYLNDKPARKSKTRKAQRRHVLKGENPVVAHDPSEPKRVRTPELVEEDPQPEEPAPEEPEIDGAGQESVEEVVQEGPAPVALAEPDETVEAADRADRPLNFLDNLDARAKAKAENRPVLILWYGSDWMPYSAKLVKQWNKLAKRRLPVQLGQINEKVGAVPKLHDRERLLPIGAFMNLPVAVLMAPDETLLGIYTGKTVMSAAAMEKAVENTLSMMPAYMKLVETARNTEGVAGAMAAAQALAMQPLETARRNRQLKDILNRKDAGNETLFRFLYCMDHMGMFNEIDAVLNGGKGADAKFKGAERQFGPAVAFVESVLKLIPGSGELKQQWISGLAYVFREQYKATKEPALRSKMVSLYRQVAELDPESEYGKGALRWANYWDEKHPYVFEEPYYDSGEMTVGFEKEWRVNVSSQMKGAGTYTFTIQPIPSKNGRMSTKGFQLFANGKHVCDSDAGLDKDTKSVTFHVPRSLNGRVEVRFRVQCFDGWFGCAGEMIMKKN